MPDDELFELAAKRRIDEEHWTLRFAACWPIPKSTALVENFAMQWLQLRRLKTVAPDPKLFPTFNEPLRAAMLKETELFFEAIIREDRSILDLVDADFTYLNGRWLSIMALRHRRRIRTARRPSDAGGQPIRGPSSNE